MKIHHTWRGKPPAVLSLGRFRRRWFLSAVRCRVQPCKGLAPPPNPLQHILPLIRGIRQRSLQPRLGEIAADPLPPASLLAPFVPIAEACYQTPPLADAAAPYGHRQGGDPLQTTQADGTAATAAPRSGCPSREPFRLPFDNRPAPIQTPVPLTRQPAATEASHRNGTPESSLTPGRSAMQPGTPLGREFRQVVRSSPQVLTHATRAFLEPLLRMRIGAVPVYVDARADRIARAFGADAIAWQGNILMRRTAHRPRHADGIALLAHELTHLAQSSRQRPLTPHGEESLAMQSELRALDACFQRPLANLAVTPPSEQRTVPAATPVSVAGSQVKAARTGRLESRSQHTASAGNALSAQEIVQLKEDIYRDLMDRLRTDFERGG